MKTEKPKCPRCGGRVTKSGGRPNGKQKWACVDRRRKGPDACKWEGVDPVHSESAQLTGAEPGISNINARFMRAKTTAVRRYVVTGAQNATPVHEGFLASLRRYCEENDATLVVIPYRYKNPTSMWSQAARDEDWWAPEVTPDMMFERVRLGDHMEVLGDIRTQPTAMNPTSGFETISASRSAILAHPKLELVAVPTPQTRLPKLITTTGVVTKRNYIQSVAGKKGEFHHTFGAAVVEVMPTGGYHLRQINALDNGTFCDLGRHYEPTGSVDMPALGLVMGDTHVKFVDPQVVEATFGPGGMLETLQPEYLVWHDVHDGYAANHHHAKDLLVNYVKHHTGNANIERELKQTFDFIASWALSYPHITHVFPASNHPGWLERWIKEADPRRDLENVVLWAKLWQWMAANAHMTDIGLASGDPFAHMAGLMLPKSVAERCKFLGTDESFRIGGIEVGMHGHLGANGARGTLRGFGKIGTKSIVGHTHTPGIRDGVYQVGTSTRLRLEYNRGPSSWLNTHCVIYRNGKRSLINIIDGTWRA